MTKEEAKIETVEVGPGSRRLMVGHAGAGPVFPSRVQCVGVMCPASALELSMTMAMGPVQDVAVDAEDNDSSSDSDIEETQGAGEL